MTEIFRFVQFDFPLILGPADGRYIVKEPGSEEARGVLVLQSATAARRVLSRRRPRTAAAKVDPEPVPITRATVIRTAPLPDEGEAGRWLASVSGDEREREAEVQTGLGILNMALHVHQVATTEPQAFEVGVRQALEVRLGYGGGDQVAEGEWLEAKTLPPEARRVRRTEALKPQERMAATLSGRERVEPWETLVLRARLDLDQGRLREAALQIRVGLEAFLAAAETSPMGAKSAEDVALASGQRQAIGAAANAALRGELDEDATAVVSETIAACLRVLRRRSLT